MLQEEYMTSPISNRRTLSLKNPIKNRRVTGKNSLILIERNINQTGPILNCRTDIKIDPKSSIMSNNDPILNCRMNNRIKLNPTYNQTSPILNGRTDTNIDNKVNIVSIRNPILNRRRGNRVDPKSKQMPQDIPILNGREFGNVTKHKVDTLPKKNPILNCRTRNSKNYKYNGQLERSPSQNQKTEEITDPTKIGLKTK